MGSVVVLAVVDEDDDDDEEEEEESVGEEEEEEAAAVQPRPAVRAERRPPVRWRWAGACPAGRRRKWL